MYLYNMVHYPMTYSVDFRKKALAIKAKENISFEATARRFDISKSALQRWSKDIEPKKTRNKKPFKIDMKALQKDIELYPDSYCYERAKRLGVSSTGIRDAQYRLGVTYKKNLDAPESGSRTKVYVLPGDSKAER